MSLFARRSKPALRDPIFGELALGKHGWLGEAAWLHGSSVLVRVERHSGPSDSDRVAFSLLKANYDSIVPKLREALFVLWQPSLAGPVCEGGPTTPQRLWEMLELSSLAVLANGTIELLFAFAGDLWPDAMFNVGIDGTNVRPLSLDD